MTKQEYGALKCLERVIEEHERFEQDLQNCLLYKDKERILRCFKKFDTKLQIDVMTALQKEHQKQITELQEEFNRLLEGENNG